MHGADLRRPAARVGAAPARSLLKAADLHADRPRVVHHRGLRDLLHVVHVERARAGS